MKKIFLIAIALISLQGIAQKTVIYINSSRYPLLIGDIVTIYETDARRRPQDPPQLVYGFPTFRNTSINRGGSFITVNAGDSYTLQNTDPTKFPFLSTGNTPQLDEWSKIASSSSSPVAGSSTAADAVGASQVFHYTKFAVSSPLTEGATFASPKPGISGAGAQSYTGTYTAGDIQLIGEKIIITIYNL